ncbi:hypothetical protein CKO28_08265 [Rhodovibrio sodomensis]|uniref:Uncharacterized protein n=1 Tax=Rhodovibrio sodomensis TaxID=1088 RepID=A0ABS1DDR8_9PROT|nr:hypothetical protein [Rhodovibrio sodomensis]MBK1668029.1 hypothetical protein [Rhodovibrio sodomensis]
MTARRLRSACRNRRSLGCVRACAALLVAGLLAFAVPWPAAAQASDRYVADVADLPLMDGLEEVTAAGMAFDKPSGRIVEAYAHGAVATAAVRRFYRQTLPQLGWQRLGPDRFAREDEELEIDYLGADGDLTVRYTLQPR